MFDTKTQTIHLYFGAGIMSPNLSVSFTVAPGQDQGVTTGWNFGLQINKKASINLGNNFKLNSPFKEIGIGTQGISLSAYYVFGKLASTGNLRYSLISTIADFIS